MESWISLPVLLTLLLLLPSLFLAQCPDGPIRFDPICSDAAPPGAWLSNITGRRIPIPTDARAAMVTTTWQPDPSIPVEESAYRVFTRIRGRARMPFTSTNSTSSLEEFTVGSLQFDTRYEATVCYANTSGDLLVDSGFIPECGYCITCFRTENEGVLLNITSATVAQVLVMSEVESELYICRAVAEPTSPEITWSAQRSSDGSVVQLMDGVNDIHISSNEENGQSVSTLRLPFNGDFLMPFCMLSNNVSNGGVQNEEFTPLDPITASVNITLATVVQGTVINSYECRAVAIPLPVEISWTGEDAQGNNINLIDDIVGVEISGSVEGSETIGKLSAVISNGVSSVACTATNGDYPGVTQREFQIIADDATTPGAIPTTTITGGGGGGGGSDSVSIPIYAIVLLVVMLAVVVPILVVISILIYRRFFASRRHKQFLKAIGMTTRQSLTMSQEQLRESSEPDTVAVLREMLPQGMFILPSDLNVSSIVGHGEFGIIYKAYMQSRDGSAQEPVAVKALKGIFATSSDIETATEEIIKMSQFTHPNVMKLVGVCVAPAEQGGNSVGPSIVMPFMAKGNLLDYLRKEADNLFAAREEQIPRIRKPLVQICQQIAKGMEYLSEIKFVHRDLAARNCLIDSNGVIKISDFGLTEDVYSRNYFRQARHGAKLPLKWMALESIKLGVFSEKSDVWSYGVTAWEVFNGGAIPYPGTHPQAVLDYLEGGERLAKPKNLACCSSMYGVLLSCWKDKPEERPTFTEILQTLEYFLEALAEYFDISGLRSCDGTCDTEEQGAASPTGTQKYSEPYQTTSPGYCVAAAEILSTPSSPSPSSPSSPTSPSS